MTRKWRRKRRAPHSNSLEPAPPAPGHAGKNSGCQGNHAYNRPPSHTSLHSVEEYVSGPVPQLRRTIATVPRSYMPFCTENCEFL
ncbi:hypothetical protein XENTR_v10006891 [Xenopus tropicalis]|nr:hypothetical protein XENTR_v10006891 [Xenopus tropicalis]